jgi:pSer/pThr/pTyr-binding forkhead associated (FHA) protein
MADEIKKEGEGQIKGETIAMTGDAVPVSVTRFLLKVEQGPAEGKEIPLSLGDNTVGRTLGLEVHLEDQSVSRKHAIITQGKDECTIEDLGSHNGTFVNGQKISKKTSLKENDQLKMGIYGLKLIKKVVKQEDAKPVADWEGRTIMKPRS